MDKEKLIEELFAQGILVTKEILEKIDRGETSDLLKKLKEENNLLVLTDDSIELLEDKQGTLIDWYEMDKYRVDFEKEGDEDLYQSNLQNFRTSSLTSNHNLSDESDKLSQTVNSHEFEATDDGAEVSFDSGEIDFEAAAIPLESLEAINSSPSHNLNANELNINSDNGLEEDPSISYSVVINYAHIAKKYTVKDFVNIFKSRYKFLEKIIRAHPEMKNVTSINRVLQKKEREECAIIGIVYDIALTKNGNYIITIEDTTGQMKVIVSKKNNPEMFEQVQDLIFDEVIGVVGSNSGDVIFASNVIWPDVPRSKVFKKSPKEEYAIFLSDIHVGSNNFMEKEFQKFIDWVCSKNGSEKQKELARKVKYIFIAGDVVDGIGIYPSQKDELTIDSMQGQYDEFTKFIKQIPKDKKIFICPGNHDIVHLAEPQSVFYKDHTEALHEMENVFLVSNPSMINIGKSEDFEGLDILMYHGYSFDFYVANVDSIRNNGGYNRADLIMKYLLKRRHLAPAFKSTPYLPAYKEDPLIIKKVPDIMISGHIHYSSVANYKGVTMICGSCWQSKTEFQEKLGHNPEPGRVPIVNLKTREVKVLRFV